MTSKDSVEGGRGRTRGVLARWAGAVCIALGLTTGAAHAETRTLKLYNVHTKERVEIAFKKNGRYDLVALKKANLFLRDWRRNEPTKMDPRLLDLVWEVYRNSGSRDYINVVCGYRSPSTNSMLRSRSRGVAEKSQHMLGKAMDFFIPDVKLATLRAIGLRAQMGGVGYYPRSGSPFVHMDVGNVRHWPRMTRKELVAVFPNGNTLHVPSDGKPLPGYEQALASYNARKRDGMTALALAGSGGKSRSGGLLASLFNRGGGADEAEDAGGDEEVAAAPARTRAVQVASVEKPSSRAAGKIQIVPPELANRVDVAPVDQEDDEADASPEKIIAALPARSIPLPAFAPRPKADIGVEAIAAVDPERLAPAASPAAASAKLPFGLAADEAQQTASAADDQPAEEDVANVPLPTWRPGGKPALTADAGAEDPTVLAMVAEHQNPAVAATESLAQAIPLPTARPASGEVTIASLSAAGPMGAEEAIADSVRVNKERLAALASTRAPSKMVSVTDGDAGTGLAIPAGAKTTKKSARATARDGKPAAKPVVVAAQPVAARWAFGGDYAAAAPAANAPAIARKLVRTAPAEVYASGFEASGAVADAGSFSGRAISFMPVARFATN